MIMPDCQIRSQTSRDDWQTPPFILEALGSFDLDPCVVGDRGCFDGLYSPWAGRVWLNPPYSQLDRWLARMAEHGNGVALTFARTETKAFEKWVWPYASGLLFLYRRLHFHHPQTGRAKHNSGAPSVLIAYGSQNAASLRACSLPGAFVTIDKRPSITL